MIAVTAHSGALSELEADVLAFVVQDPVELPGSIGDLGAAASDRLAALVEAGDAPGRTGAVTIIASEGAVAAQRLALVGAGKPARFDIDALRTAAARLVERTRDAKIASIAWVLDPDLPVELDRQAVALTEGTALGSFDHGGRKTVDDRPAAVETLALAHADGQRVAPAAARAASISRRVNTCRELVDAPGNELTPAALAERAGELADEIDGLTCEVWGPAEIQAASMGAFGAVGQGSENPPRLITLRWEPDAADGDLHLGLVGKAITFDTGGISIKPSARMADMKTDMAGGAAVLAAAAAIAELELPVRVTTVIPACENMPDGKSYRPGDVLTAKNGKTIEVTNTDAEGRLILADALTHCRELGATHIVDLATLTGACVVALGDFYAGLLGNDDDWVRRVEDAARLSGDHAWQLPLHETYRRHIGSTFADMKNSSDLRQAGSIYAASFLAEFVGEGPWAHLDIAGVASLDRGRGDYFTGPGATGYGVRLLVELASSLADSA